MNKSLVAVGSIFFNPIITIVFTISILVLWTTTMMVGEFLHPAPPVAKPVITLNDMASCEYKDTSKYGQYIFYCEKKKE